MAAFESLLEKSAQTLKRRHREKEFDCGGEKLEKILHGILVELSKDTPFENTFEITGKFSFPDIVSKIQAEGWLGIEVKTSKKGWKCFGNSIFETTRYKGEEKEITSIYIFFARLENFDVKWAKYESVLETINITHSPRYSINMEIPRKRSPNVFDLMCIGYDKFRKADAAQKMEYVKSLKREQNKDGIALWWLSSEEETQSDEQYKFKLLEDLSVEERERLISEGLVRFPEVFSGKNGNKYKSIAKWLLQEKGVTSTSLRDKFSASGQTSLQFGNMKELAPQVFSKIRTHKVGIREVLQKLSLETGRTPDEQLEIWAEDIRKYSIKTIPANFPIVLWIKHEIQT